MSRIRIGWDIDGVGFTFGDSFRNWLEHTGRGHLWKSGPNEKPYWNFYQDWGWTSKQFVEECHAAADAGILFSGPVRPGYREGIIESSKIGDIIIATDRPFGRTPVVSERLTVDWFRQHDIPWDEMYFTANKPDAKCDVFIDDKVENFEALNAAGCEAYLLTRPWNEYYGQHDRRVDNIEEFVENIT